MSVPILINIVSSPSSKQHLHHHGKNKPKYQSPLYHILEVFSDILLLGLALEVSLSIIKVFPIPFLLLFSNSFILFVKTIIFIFKTFTPSVWRLIVVIVVVLLLVARHFLLIFLLSSILVFPILLISLLLVVICVLIIRVSVLVTICCVGWVRLRISGVVILLLCFRIGENLIGLVDLFEFGLHRRIMVRMILLS